jgi:hypothetical protein
MEIQVVNSLPVTIASVRAHGAAHRVLKSASACSRLVA